MSTLATLATKLTLDAGAFQSGMKSVVGSAQQTAGAVEGTLGRAFRSVGQIALGVFTGNLMTSAFKSVANLIQTGFQGVMRDQQVFAQLDAVLESTGKQAKKQAEEWAAGLSLIPPVARMTRDALIDHAKALSLVTANDRESINATQAMLLTFTSIGKETFPTATEAILDMATAMNRGAVPSAEQLKSTAIQVGKALQDPIQGVTALRRVGVNFSKEQQAQMEQWVAQGKILEAQKFILAELAVEFGGSAKAAGKTLPGALAILKNNFGEIGETLLGVVIPSLTSLAQVGLPLVLEVVQRLEGVVAQAEPKVSRFFQTMIGATAALRPIAAVLGGNREALVDVLTALESAGVPLKMVLSFTRQLGRAGNLLTQPVKALRLLRLGFIGLGPAIEALRSGGGLDAFIGALFQTSLRSEDIYRLVGGFRILQSVLGPLAPQAQALFANLREGLMRALPTLLPALQAMGAAIMANLGQMDVGSFGNQFRAILDAILPIIPQIGALFVAVLPVFISTFVQITALIASFRLQIVSGLVPVLAQVLTWVTANMPRIQQTISVVLNAVQGIWNTVWPNLLRVIQAVVPVLLQAIALGFPIFQQLATIVQGVIAQIAPVLTGFILQAVALIQTNLPLIQSIIMNALTLIQTVWNFVWPYLQIVLEGIWNAISIIVQTTLNVVSGLIQAALSAVQGDWSGAWENVKQVGLDLWNGIQSLLANWLGTMASLISGKVGDFVQLGRDLWAGLMRGIQGAVDAAIDSVKNWVKSLINAAKDAAGISSPSLEFIQIGVQMMLGLAAGLLEGQPDTIRAMNEIVSGLGSALSSIIGAAQAAGQAGALPDLGALALWLRTNLANVATALNEVNAEIGADALVHAKDVANVIEELFSGLTPDLGEFAKAEQFPDMILVASRLKDAVKYVAGAIHSVVAELGLVSIADAAAAAAPVKEVLSLLASSLNIGAVPVDFASQIIPFVQALETGGSVLVSWLRRIPEYYRTTVLPEISKVAQALKPIYELLSVGKLLSKAASYAGSGDKDVSMRKLVKGLIADAEMAGSIIVGWLERIPAYYKETALPAAAAAAEQIKQVFEVLSLGEMLQKAAEYKSPGQSAIEGLVGPLVNDIRVVVDLLVNALAGFDETVLAAEGSKAKSIVEMTGMLSESATSIWDAWDAGGIPVNELAVLVRQLNAAQAVIGAGGLPPGMKPGGADEINTVPGARVFAEPSGVREAEAAAGGKTFKLLVEFAHDGESQGELELDFDRRERISQMIGDLFVTATAG